MALDWPPGATGKPVLFFLFAKENMLRDSYATKLGEPKLSTQDRVLQTSI